MARLEPGQCEKIDNINRLVKSVMDTGNEGDLESLLALFHPLILNLASKWSEYFNDRDHRLLPWDDLISEAQCWFIHYTKNKYTLDGAGTYNTFIKQHMDSRIRYIYECALKYNMRHVFPDPDKHSEEDDDMLTSVIFRYSDSACDEMSEEIDTNIMSAEYHGDVSNVVKVIMMKLDDRTLFNDREKEIFTLRYVNDMSHEDIGRKFNISRARVSQIIAKMKIKLQDIVLDSQSWWDIVEEME